jgi:hypothetical protein
MTSSSPNRLGVEGVGVPASPSGFRPSDGAASVSTATAASIPNACECGNKPRLFAAAGEYRLKCSCGTEGAWAEHSLGALNAWNSRP